MNSKIKKAIWITINAIALTGLSFIQRHYFPETVEVPVVDSVTLVQHQSKVDSLYFLVDSLKEELNKKPKVVIRKVPINTIIRKDSIIYRDSVVLKEIIKIDTVVVETSSEEDSDNIVSINTDDTQYFGELFVLGKKNKTIVKTNKRYFKKGDLLYFTDGEDLNNSLSVYFVGNNLKRRIKFNVSSVYVLLTSTNEDVEKRILKLIKNKNII